MFYHCFSESLSQILCRGRFDGASNIRHTIVVYSEALMSGETETAALSIAPEQPNPLAKFLIGGLRVSTGKTLGFEIVLFLGHCTASRNAASCSTEGVSRSLAELLLSILSVAFALNFSHGLLADCTTLIFICTLLLPEFQAQAFGWVDVKLGKHQFDSTFLIGEVMRDFGVGSMRLGCIEERKGEKKEAD